MPADLASGIRTAVDTAGEESAWAVRSSATAEDQPMTSFAGQHDSYLDVVGSSAVIERVSQCWASLFTERAVTYRQRNGLDHRGVGIAVVVQQMVDPKVSGVLFTADPVSCDRTVVVIEASAGLGEALVSGLVTPDVFRVREGAVLERTGPVLSDRDVLRLAEIGRRIETHFGAPQDVEWCLVDDDIHVVQSRPITTLFPIPVGADDTRRIYVSVGHGQMMTDAMKPLGLSVWQMTTPAPMCEAGGRLFVDVTKQLANPTSRAALLDAFGKSDVLLRDALQTIVDREDDALPLAGDAPPGPPPTVLLDPDPAVVTELIAESQASIAACARDIGPLSGSPLFDFIRGDFPELRRLLFDPRSHQVFMTAIEATWWLNEHIETWLGDKNVADTLTQSVPHNVTSEMGLALLDVADVVRPHPAVVSFMSTLTRDGPRETLDPLDHLDGGPAARSAIEGFLATYGMRCSGEIDITRPRWSERPTTLIPLVLAHVKNMEAGESERRFERGRQEAAAKEQDVLERLRSQPDGERKAADTKVMIDRVRTFMGYREYPKYGMVSRYFLYKRALMREGQRLVEAGVLRDPDDIDFLRFDELHEVARTNHADHELIDQRRAEFRAHQTLTAPRVLTSDGEAVDGSYRGRDVPDGALVGLAVSSGTVEGRARVITDIANSDLAPGDILVTGYTDPSWTPLFVSIAGLVTEVGGMMTHGAVIAREYGLPAVVAVDGATRHIGDGQRIRVHGTDGYVELLPPDTV